MPRTALALLTVLATLVAAPSASAAPPPPLPEPIEQVIVPMPAHVTDVRFAAYTADGSRVLASARSTTFSGTQIVSFAEDGSDFECITCPIWQAPSGGGSPLPALPLKGLVKQLRLPCPACDTWAGAPLFKPIAFPDGKRVLLRVGEQTPSSPADHGVLECSPSVVDCREATVLPIVVPAGTERNVEQDGREFRIAPDAEHVGFSQIRRTAAAGSESFGVVGRLVRGTSAYTVADPRVVGVGAELKNFTGDGQGVLLARYSRGDEAGNPDDIRIDLATGEISRATSHPDWDEDIHETAQDYQGRRWRVVGSARGAGLLEAFSQLRRPSAIDIGVSALPFIAFGQHRAAIAEPWLIDDRGERDGYIGQPLLPHAIASGWDSRATTTFKPDGTAAVTWQLRVGGEGTRVVVARFTSRQAMPVPAAGQTPQPAWAPRLPGFVPPEPEVPQSRDGAVAGRMTVTLLPAPDPFDLLIEVRYNGFADREGWVIDGVETSVFTPGGVYGGASLYNASLTLSGEHQGWLRASNVLLVPTVGIRGKIESEVDGRRLAFGR